MPKGDQTGRMHGFQLWAYLPAALKMTKPRYQEVKATDIPEITDDDGTLEGVISLSDIAEHEPARRAARTLRAVAAREAPRPS